MTTIMVEPFSPDRADQPQGVCKVDGEKAQLFADGRELSLSGKKVFSCVAALRLLSIGRRIAIYQVGRA